MFVKNLRKSITKLILPFLHKIFQLLKTNTRAVNFLNEKKNTANYIYNFQIVIEKLLKNKKLIGLDVGARGGFNSDKFFPEKLYCLHTSSNRSPLFVGSCEMYT